MKKLGVVLAAGLVAGVLGSGAGAQPGDKANGGGQITVDMQHGAGDTVAFTLQGSGTDVKGQFQYVDRTGGTGQGGDSWHGSPVCFEVLTENTAKAVIRRDDTNSLYELLLTDNGQGQDDDDLVTLSTDSEPNCGTDDNDDENNTSLGRGNIQIWQGE